MISNSFLEKYKSVLNDSEFEEFKSACSRPLRKSIRVNTLKISIDNFLDKAKEEGWILSQIPWCPTGFWIDREDRSRPLGTSYLHQCGYFYIQEASSMIPPQILNPSPGDKVLDISAAPGSKTTQIACLMENKGAIVANEPIAGRIKSLKSNIDRMGVSNTIITQKDGRAFSQYFPNYFDKVLVDAPCTGEGTIRKDIHALDNWNEKAIEKLSKLQKMLITEALHALKVGGELVYSTCTLSPEEDEYVVQYLLDEFKGSAEIVPISFCHPTLSSFCHPALDAGSRKKQKIDSWSSQEGQGKNLEIENNPYGLNGVLRVWPHTFDTEGFFIAKIRKTKETFSNYYESIKPWQRKSPFKKVEKLKDGRVEQLISSIGKESFYELGNELWFKQKITDEIAKYISIHSSGILIGNIDKNRNIDLNYEGAFYLYQLGFEFDGNLDLTKEEMERYLKGYDIENKSNMEGNIVLKYNGLFIGFGKTNGRVIKNKFPRYLVLS